MPIISQHSDLIRKPNEASPSPEIGPKSSCSAPLNANSTLTSCSTSYIQTFFATILRWIKKIFPFFFRKQVEHIPTPITERDVKERIQNGLENIEKSIKHVTGDRVFEDYKHVLVIKYKNETLCSFNQGNPETWATDATEKLTQIVTNSLGKVQSKKDRVDVDVTAYLLKRGEPRKSDQKPAHWISVGYAHFYDLYPLGSSCKKGYGGFSGLLLKLYNHKTNEPSPQFENWMDGLLPSEPKHPQKEELIEYLRGCI